MTCPFPSRGGVRFSSGWETSGLCHTDIHAAHGDWPVKPSPPFVPGHEGIGIVDEARRGRHAHAASVIGSPIAWLGYACGSCRYCIGGWETLCEKQHNSGYSVDGTLRRILPCAEAAFATPGPATVSSRDAAPLRCAGVTTYKAIKVARVVPAEDWSPSSASGASATWRCSTRASSARSSSGRHRRRQSCRWPRSWAPTSVVNATTRRPGRGDRRPLAAPMWLLCLAASPASPSIRPTARCVAAGGSCCVALPADNGALSLPIFDTVINGKPVIGSIVGTRNDLAEEFDLHAAGRTTVMAIDRKLDEVNESIAEVLAGTAGPDRLPVLTRRRWEKLTR